MTTTRTLRGPHDIRVGEAVATKFREGWEVHYAGTFVPESNREGAADHRVLPPDEIRDLQPGDRVVNIGTGEEAQVSTDGGRCISLRGLRFYCESTAAHLTLALLSLAEPEPHEQEMCDDTCHPSYEAGYKAGWDARSEFSADIAQAIQDEDEPDGSWDKPWPVDTDEDKHDGWHCEDDGSRHHYRGGWSSHSEGPYEVRPDGTRRWTNSAVLPPGVYSDDLPGGGTDAPWSNGYEEAQHGE